MSLNWQADWNETGRFLKGFREWRGDGVKDIARHLQKNISQTNVEPFDPEELREGVTAQGGTLPFLERLERSQGGKDLCRATVQLLASAYDVPPLLLDPLFSRSQRGVRCLVESIQTFERVNDHSRYYGIEAEYSIPQTKLDTGTGVSFGHLRLNAANGRSDIHDHPGTELMLLLDGSEIELRLETSGVRIPLRKGEFVHFRSEMPHSAWNRSPHAASVFVIRFYQLRADSTREKVARITAAALGNLKEYQQKVNELKRWIGAKTRRRQGTGQAPPEVSDREKQQALEEMIADLPQAHKLDNRLPYVDLPNIVKCLTERVSSKYLDELKKISPEDIKNLPVKDLFGLALLLDQIKGAKKLKKIASKEGFGASELSKIHNAQKPLTVQDLEVLAQQYEIEAMILYAYLFPTEPDVVVGRLEGMAALPESVVDPGVQYWCPRCSLALSDINVFFIELQPGQATRTNAHPGFELALPLEDSTFVIEIEGESKLINGSQQQYGHYASKQPHRLRNVGSAPGKAFIVRFFLQ